MFVDDVLLMGFTYRWMQNSMWNFTEYIFLFFILKSVNVNVFFARSIIHKMNCTYVVDISGYKL